MKSNLHSYPSVYAIGHAAVKELFSGPVIVEEKVDGSQFSFGIIDGAWCFRSKGQALDSDAPEKMFAEGVESVKGLDLHPGWTYRGEYLQKPKHNTLVYSRVPAHHVILFDINTGQEEYLSPAEKQTEAQRLGLEFVPLLYSGVVSDFDMLKGFLEIESVLGGTTIEGVVVKNYSVFTPEKKAAMGKYVSEAFKENNATNWREQNPTSKDTVGLLVEKYRTEARWEKAVQHLRDAGILDGSPRDIPALMKEVQADILKEEEAAIKDALFRPVWPTISRGVTRGLPEWWKDRLAKSAFEDETK